LLLLANIAALFTISAATSQQSLPIILRIRKPDGSMGKIQVVDQETTTLSSILSIFLPDDYNTDDTDGSSIKCSISDKEIEDSNQPVSSFNLKNGSLITIAAPPLKKSKRDETTNKIASPSIRFTEIDPFPHLAKSSHSAAVRRSRALSRLPSRRSMSYSDIADLHSYMHVMEPQPEGPIKRIYMCSIGAQRFKDNCTIMPTKKQLKATKGKAEAQIRNRCAVLFGTVNKERVDQSINTKGRTSLSTPLYEMKMCQVVKVHAVWEPNQGGSENAYDSRCFLEGGEEYKRAVEIAKSLGMRVVGWMFSYSDDRVNVEDDKKGAGGEDGLPVFARDIIHGAKGQIRNMELIGRDEGLKYVTLALDAKTGATEAFQLSDVTVQMVAEGVLTLSDKEAERGNVRRFVTTQESIIVDNKETKELDTVLCLVNTALLSHQGRFSGSSGVTSVKKGGGLSAKKKKAFLEKIDAGDDSGLVEELCDFGALLALDKSMDNKDMERICNLVNKFSKGQRKSLEVDKSLKLIIQSIVSS
jgi:NPL4 family.